MNSSYSEYIFGPFTFLSFLLLASLFRCLSCLTFTYASLSNVPITVPTMACHYSTLEIGVPNTLEYRIFVTRNGTSISPFHDIPLYYDSHETVLNMVVEIPRWTNNKLEVSNPEYKMLFMAGVWT